MNWVLLRGLTRESRHWADVPARLARQFNATQRVHADPRLGPHQVLTQDLPGNGEYAWLPSPGSVGDMAAFARAQLRLKGQAPPYCLVAMSLGGMVATHWAQTWPQEVQGLVLINTSMRPHSRLTERLRPANWPALAQVVARWRQALFVEQTLHRLTCQRTDTLASDVAAWVRIREGAPVRAANALQQLRAAAGYACAPHAPACPTLLLSSRHDQLVSPICSERLASAWRVPHRQHPWAGHDLPHDDADWLCEQIAGWLQAGL